MLRSLLLAFAILSSIVTVGCGISYFMLLPGYHAHTLMREEMVLLAVCQFLAMAGLVAAIPGWIGYFWLKKSMK